MVSLINKNPARCIAILGTASDVGKSVVTTALCRIASDMGIAVAPFKAQNMSNNSFVTSDGGEMGRAQVAQAEAARLAPNVDMNPVLLKPNSDMGVQIVLHGSPHKTSDAVSYGLLTPTLLPKATESLDRLRNQFDLVIMEGAGSCAEINLKSRDIVNFKMANIADAKVLLVADIDRGGVFAQIIGTLDIISKEERERVKGIVINRFRGDPTLFAEGIEYIEKRTGVPVLGLIPYLQYIGIDSEDAVVLDNRVRETTTTDRDKVHIAVIRLPRISNFTDFSPLDSDPAVQLDYLQTGRPLGRYDLVLIPGTKNVRADLTWLKETGFAERIREFVENGGRLGGICGGFQMLGRGISDPKGIEGPPGSTAGLGFLPMTTSLFEQKVLTHTSGVWLSTGDNVAGYEIHQGRTDIDGEITPLIRITKINEQTVSKEEGVLSPDGRVFGTYLHGLFDTAEFRQRFLVSLRPDLEPQIVSATSNSAAIIRERHYDRLASHFMHHMKTDLLRELLQVN